MTQNVLPEDSEARKRIPVCTGLYDYFPAAIEALIQYHAALDLETDLGLTECFADKVAVLLPKTGGRIGPYKASVVLAWECLDAALALMEQESGVVRYKDPNHAGFVDYFAPVLAAIAELSWAGNNKHNPGQPLHWSRWLSPDHRDCIGRHSFDFEGTGADGMRHCVTTCWRALALLQLECEAEGAPVARSAKLAPDDPCAELTRLTEALGGYAFEDEPTMDEKQELVRALIGLQGQGMAQTNICRDIGVNADQAKNWFRRACGDGLAWSAASDPEELDVIAALEKDLAQCP